MKKLGIFFLFCIALLTIAALVLNSDWAQKKASHLISSSLAKSGLSIEIESIEGVLPNRVHLKNVSIKKMGWAVSVESVDANISLWRLLNNELAFNQLNAEGVIVKKEEITSAPLTETLKENPSMSLYVRSFHLKQVQLPERYTMDLQGHLRWNREKKYLHVIAKRPEFPDTSAKIWVRLKPSGIAQIKANIDTPTFKALGLEEPFDAHLALQLNAHGPLSDLDSWKGRINGTLTPIAKDFPEPMRGWVERKWNYAGKFQKEKMGGWVISPLSVQSNLIRLKVKAALDSSFHLKETIAQIQSDHLIETLPYSLSGRLLGQLTVDEQNHIRASLQIPTLHVGSLQMERVRGKGEAVWENHQLKGDLSLWGQFLEEEWKGKTNFSWDPGASLALSDVQLAGPHVEGKGNIQWTKGGLFTGTSELTIQNLQNLPLPAHPFYGSLVAKGEWHGVEQVGGLVQGVHLDTTLTEFYYGPFYSEKISLYTDLINPFQSLSGNAYLDLEHAKWEDLLLESASLETASEGDVWPFRLFAEGTWKHPLELHLNGQGSYKDSHLVVRTDTGTGNFFRHTLSLEEPWTLEWSPDIFRLTDLHLNVGGGTLYANLDRRGDETDGRFKCTQLPLDLLALQSLDVSVDGVLNLDLSLHEANQRLKGTLSASVNQMAVSSLREVAPLKADGTIEGSFDRDRLDVLAHFQVRNTPILHCKASLPIHLSVWPFQASLVTDKSAQGNLTFDGRVEDFIDFFDLGTHRLEGHCKCDFTLRNTLQRPLLEGTGQFENGYYENYYTGTQLRHIQADFLGEKQKIYLRSLTALDGKEGGKLTAFGEIDLRPNELYPFRFDVGFSQFKCVEIDLVTTFASGKIQIQGNQKSALAHGNIEVTESELTIPNHIPRPLPNLQVVYRNPASPAAAQPEQFHPYPLYLDLHVAAPSNIFIAGRGLQSEWKGDFDIGGSYTAIAAKGKLELLKGEFNFSSRSFKLTEGSLSLSGKEHEMPYLNLVGSINQKGIQINARLNGPLNSPQVTVQSVPALPLSSIMSYLLFGQNISEINGFQALQLANSVANLAGQGPDVMESTRRSLGVDRLNVVVDPGGEGSDDSVALQVGKYVSKGVIVSFSQGTEDSSTNASIEVEIKDNLIFQAETQQQQEQGKFTIKWSLNY